MAKHTPPDDNSFSLSLLRHLAAAVALVAVVAAAFWGVGQVKDDGIGTIAAGPDGTTTEEAPATDTAEPTAPASEAPPADEGTTPTEVATTPDEELTATPTEDEPAADEPTTDDTEADSAGAGAGEFDPADISVQVLDATGEGGAAGDEVAEQLTEDGFNVVATNQAVRVYEVTTVFYTPGNEAKAEQLAAMYGYDEVEPEPGNLSHSVDVHLVVGTDA